VRQQLIFTQHLTGRTSPFTALSHHTIAHLKAHLHATLGYPISHISLTHQSRYLSDHTPLVSLPPESTVRACVRLRGGTPKPASNKQSNAKFPGTLPVQVPQQRDGHTVSSSSASAAAIAPAAAQWSSPPHSSTHQPLNQAQSHLKPPL
jgi:hypothetical protein